MKFAEALDRAWGVEWHERDGHGALEVHPLREIVERNGRLLTGPAELHRGKGPLVLGVFLQLEDANEGRRVMRGMLRGRGSGERGAEEEGSGERGAGSGGRGERGSGNGRNG